MLAIQSNKELMELFLWSTQNVIKFLGFEVSFFGYKFVLETTLLFLDLKNVKTLKYIIYNIVYDIVSYNIVYDVVCDIVCDISRYDVVYNVVYDIEKYDVVYDIVYDISRYDVVYDVVYDIELRSERACQSHTSLEGRP
jgi:hypothetical protein